MHDYKRIRLFKSNFLERFSVVHPITPALLYIPVLFYCILHIKITIHSLILIFSGILLWTFIEYTMHRFIFHLPINTKWANKISYIIHGIHHKDPHDPLRLVAPPLMSLPIGLIFLYIYSKVFTSNNLFSFLFGFTLSYLCYDYLHWALHHSKSKNKLIYYLRRNHAIHHHRTPPRRFGVTSPLWDFIFNTYTLTKNRAKAE
ncbi:Fatty acid hydroxylase superfamily protein [Legionella gratiana]|uniref:Fatty acid hydroxylase superfamily n=1 Tax=Legionella gratiana TaxID=45066 RepID=A0A378JG30_9GAMM|nr:sterol desaturase family protein [Legionella gratiana]KTD12090.1 Fatty acid hydroxylase superfamily protein [Legionella gratiana]STX46306.1 Fatty acid hydroxylase superfamily [Legionella gratiana]